MQNKKYFIKTFGCAMNVSDSQRIASFLEKQGFVLTEKIESADLAIFNTCGIKQTAENRAYSLINNLRKNKKGYVKIVMTGCLANRIDVQKRMQNKVDLFCNISDFPKEISAILNEISDVRHQIPSSHLSRENINYLSINPKHTNDFHAYVPIMTGCDNFCAYCVVPYARGHEVSRPAEEIIDEVKKLIKNGYKKITLLGQNVNSYCCCNKNSSADEADKKISFPQLLKMINSIPGKFWIDFVSSHPKDMNDELIKTAAKCKKVCEWIHLPVQAGNNEVLRRMNRRYTKEHYLKLIKKIKTSFAKNKPGMPFAISSDVIVGFPSETRAQFQDSAFVMEKAKFDMVFFGQFSPRPGTAAWKMKDNVSQKEKARREKFLNEILKTTSLANNKKYVGKKIEVLIEKKNKGQYFAKTRTQKNVRITSKKTVPIGTFAKVKITKANIWNLEGEF